MVIPPFELFGYNEILEDPSERPTFRGKEREAAADGGRCDEQRYFSVDYEYRRVLKLVGTATGTIAVGVLIDQAWPSWAFGILLLKVPLCLVFLVSLFAFGVISWGDVNQVRGYLMTRFARSGAK